MLEVELGDVALSDDRPGVYWASLGDVDEGPGDVDMSGNGYSNRTDSEVLKGVPTICDGE